MASSKVRDLASLVSQLRVSPPRCDVPPRFADEEHEGGGPSGRNKTRARWDVAAIADGDLQKRRIERQGETWPHGMDAKDEEGSTGEVVEGDLVTLKVRSCCYPSERGEEEVENVAHVWLGSAEACHPQALQRAARSMRVGERALVRWKTDWNGDEGVGGGSAVVDVQLLHKEPGQPLLGNEWEIKTKQEEGEGWRTPSRGCQVRVAFRIRLMVPKLGRKCAPGPLPTNTELNTSELNQNTIEKFDRWEQQRNEGEFGKWTIAQSNGDRIVSLGDGTFPRTLERLVESMRTREGATLFAFGESAVETMNWAHKGAAVGSLDAASKSFDEPQVGLKDDTPLSEVPSPSTPSPFASGTKAMAAKCGVVITAVLEEFVPVRDVTGTGEVVMQQLRTGRGEFPSDCPLEDCDVKLRFVCISHTDAESLPAITEKINSDWSSQDLLRLIEEVEVREACLGAGELPQGLDMAVHLLLPGEVSKVSCTSTFGKKADEIPQPSNHNPDHRLKLDISWVVELVGFEKPVNWYYAEVPELMRDAQRGREKGNELFKKGKHRLAKARYEKTLGKLNGLRGMSEEEAGLVSAEKVLCHLNLAACFIHLEEFGSAIQHSTKAIELDPSCVKGYFRRGQALGLLNEYDRAREEYRAAMEIDPSCKADAEASLRKLATRERAAFASARQDFNFAFPTK